MPVRCRQGLPAAPGLPAGVSGQKYAAGPVPGAFVAPPEFPPSAPGALPVPLQPRRVLLTARLGWKLKFPLPRERNFIFMYKVCDLLKESTATYAFIYFKTAIECPMLLPLESMARVSLTERGQDQFLPVFCVII